MKLAKVEISDRFLRDLILQGYNVTGIEVTQGLPKDAEFVRSYHDEARGVAYLIYYHDSFVNVPPGGEIPILPIEYKRYYGWDMLEKAFEAAREWEEGKAYGQG